MKLQSVILLAVALLLGLIYFTLSDMRNVLVQSQQNNQSLLSSHQAVINSNQKLENSLTELRKQVGELSDKVLKR